MCQIKVYVKCKAKIQKINSSARSRRAQTASYILNLHIHSLQLVQQCVRRENTYQNTLSRKSVCQYARSRLV